MKIIKNSCFGGFSLSALAEVEYLKRKGKNAFFYKQTKYKHQDGIDEYKKTSPEEVGIFCHTLTKDLGETVNKLVNSGGEYFSSSDIKRTDLDLIATVEKLGKKADGPYARLEIVEIPDGIEWEIDEYDGAETIREAHRSW